MLADFNGRYMTSAAGLHDVVLTPHMFQHFCFDKPPKIRHYFINYRITVHLRCTCRSIEKKNIFFLRGDLKSCSLKSTICVKPSSFLKIAYHR